MQDRPNWDSWKQTEPWSTTSAKWQGQKWYEQGGRYWPSEHQRKLEDFFRRMPLKDSDDRAKNWLLKQPMEIVKRPKNYEASSELDNSGTQSPTTGSILSKMFAPSKILFASPKQIFVSTKKISRRTNNVFYGESRKPRKLNRIEGHKMPTAKLNFSPPSNRLFRHCQFLRYRTD